MVALKTFMAAFALLPASLALAGAPPSLAELQQRMPKGSAANTREGRRIRRELEAEMREVHERMANRAADDAVDPLSSYRYLNNDTKRKQAYAWPH